MNKAAVLAMLIAIAGITIGNTTTALADRLGQWADAQASADCYRDGGTFAKCGPLR